MTARPLTTLLTLAAVVFTLLGHSDGARQIDVATKALLHVEGSQMIRWELSRHLNLSPGDMQNLMEKLFEAMRFRRKAEKDYEETADMIRHEISSAGIVHFDDFDDNYRMWDMLDDFKVSDWDNQEIKENIAYFMRKFMLRHFDMEGVDLDSYFHVEPDKEDPVQGIFLDLKGSGIPSAKTFYKMSYKKLDPWSGREYGVVKEKMKDFLELYKSSAWSDEELRSHIRDLVNFAQKYLWYDEDRRRDD